MIVTFNIEAISSIELDKIKKQNIKNIEIYNKLGNILYTNDTSFEDYDLSAIKKWNLKHNYKMGTVIQFQTKEKHGIFINKWDTKETPNFQQNNSWYLIETIDKDDNFIKEIKNIEYWNYSKEYKSSDLVKINLLNKEYCFRAKILNSKEQPILVDEDEYIENIEKYNSSWIIDEYACNQVFEGKDKSIVGVSEIETLYENKNSSINSLVINPVTLKNKLLKGKREDSLVLTKVYYDYLPYLGYEFLKEIAESDWDWLFPLRAGKYNLEGEFKK